MRYATLQYSLVLFVFLFVLKFFSRRNLHENEHNTRSAAFSVDSGTVELSNRLWFFMLQEL